MGLNPSGSYQFGDAPVAVELDAYLDKWIIVRGHVLASGWRRHEYPFQMHCAGHRGGWDA